ncbi:MULTISPECIES: DUF6879 family protein [unclassified Frankia]
MVSGAARRRPGGVLAAAGPRPWLDLIAEVAGRGVEVRRVRIVAGPVSQPAHRRIPH